MGLRKDPIKTKRFCPALVSQFKRIVYNLEQFQVQMTCSSHVAPIGIARGAMATLIFGVSSSFFVLGGGIPNKTTVVRLKSKI